MELAPADKTFHKLSLPSPKGYEIVLDNVDLKEPNEEIFEIYPLKMTIK